MKMNSIQNTIFVTPIELDEKAQLLERKRVELTAAVQEKMDGIMVFILYREPRFYIFLQ